MTYNSKDDTLFLEVPMNTDDPCRDVRVFLYKARMKLSKEKDRELASMLGISRSAIYNWERQLTLPSLSRCDQIAELYALDPIEFRFLLEKAHQYRAGQCNTRKINKNPLKHKKQLIEIITPVVFRG